MAECLSSEPSRLLVPNTVDTWQSWLHQIYGRKNNILFNSRYEKIGWVLAAYRQLQVDLRSQTEDSVIEIDTARAAARTFGLADDFSVRLIDGVQMKYPEGFCIYCKVGPCKCRGVKKPYELLPVDPTGPQRTQYLDALQANVQFVYGPRNARRPQETIARLLEEPVELLMVVHDEAQFFAASVDQVQKHYTEELADTFVRCLSAANLRGISLQNALEQRYGQGCWRCHQIPCSPNICRSITFQTMD